MVLHGELTEREDDSVHYWAGQCTQIEQVVYVGGFRRELTDFSFSPRFTPRRNFTLTQ